MNAKSESHRLVRCLVVRPLFTIAALFIATTAHAAIHEVNAGSQDYLDFANAEPGDTIHLMAHTRQRLVLKNINGSPTQPILITNYGGQFIIDNTSSDKGIQIWGSKHFRLIGTPVTVNGVNQFGIKIANMTYPGANALVVTWNDGNDAYSSDFEIAGIEIADAPSIGMLVKNAGTTGSTGTFMQNVKIHSNYIHDTGTEGIYVGDSAWESQDPQELRNIEIYNNLTENTGWDGIQLSCATQGSSIHDNTIRGYGVLAGSNIEQDEGIRTNPGTAGDIYNNVIIGSPSNSGTGIFANPQNSMRIFNNVIVTPQEVGIVIQERNAVTKTYTNNYAVEIYNNTIVAPENVANAGPEQTAAIILKNMTHASGNVVQNNLIAEPTSTDPFVAVARVGGSAATVSNNTLTSTVAAAGFVSHATQNYRLVAGSPAINAGANVAPDVTTDIDGAPRPLGSAYDTGAYEYGTAYAVATIASDTTVAPHLNLVHDYTHRINLNASSAVTVNGVEFEYGTGNGSGAQAAKNYTFTTFNNAVTNFNSTATGDIHTVLATRGTNTSSASYSVTLNGLTAGERYTFVLFTDSAHNAGRGWYRVSQNLDTMTADVDFSAGGVNSSRMLAIRYVPTSTSVTFTLTRLSMGTTDSTSWVGFAGFVNYR